MTLNIDLVAKNLIETVDQMIANKESIDVNQSLNNINFSKKKVC